MKQAQVLDPLIHLLKIKSISTQEKYQDEMENARHLLVDYFNNAGFKTKVLAGKHHDLVYAELILDKKAPTVLIYGHYDVQPPEPISEWLSDPFEPEIRKDNLYARGATDNKGQLMIHLMAVKQILKSSQKPGVNFKFIIEGEEEIGSPSITKIAKQYKSLLKANYIIASDSQMPKKGQPSIDISLRGMLYTEIHLQTSAHDVHSGQFGGAAENPAIILAYIISKLKNENGKVLIPGFYKDVKKPSKSELISYASSGLTRKKVINEGKLFLTGGGERNRSLVERMWTRPTLDVNEIWGGYTDAGEKTIIPKDASAKISMRLVHNQTPDEIFKLYKSFIKKITPKGVKIKIERNADCLPYKAPIDEPVYDLMKESLKKSFGRNPVYTGVGGSIGFIPVIANTLNAPCILVGFGLPTDNLHAPNEHFFLPNFYKGIETMKHFYSNIDNVANKQI